MVDDGNVDNNPSNMKKSLKNLFRVGFQFLTNFVKMNPRN